MMTKTRSIVFLGATALLLGCTAGVTPTMTGAAGAGPGAAGNSGGGTTGSGGTSSGSAGTGFGFDASLDISVSDTKSDGVCSSTMTAAEPVPLDLYVLMDTSLSMNEATSTGTKWGDVRKAMESFFESQSSAGLGVGLKFFPGVQSGAPATCTGDGSDPACNGFGECDRRKTCVPTASSTTAVSPLCTTATAAANCGSATCSLIKDCTGGNYCAAGPTAPATACTGCNTFPGYCHLRDRCDAAYYAAADVAIGLLDGTTGGQAAMLKTSLEAKSPAGYTPTGPALTGALMFARQRIAAMPTHRVAVVLVTDGLPGGFLPGFPPAECMPTSIAAQGSDPGIAPLLRGTMGSTGAPPVPTFVIGVFAPGAAAQTAQTNLDMLAKAGQNLDTATAVIIDTGQNVATALQNALKAVQSKAIACEYKLPTGGVDFKQVNVSFTNASGSTTIGHAPIDGTTGAGCDARGGWYYDKDPATGTPTKITACPASCSMFQTDLNGHVDVVLGCPTIDVN